MCGPVAYHAFKGTAFLQYPSPGSVRLTGQTAQRIYEKNFLRGIVHLKIVTGFAGYVVTVVGQGRSQSFPVFR